VSSAYVPATAGVWFGFDFDTPFDYNGSSNLIMEVDWNTDSGGYCYCRSNSEASRFAYSYNGGSVYVSSYFHYQRVTIGATGVAPTSLGRVKSLYH
jgi:hypothetical protein